MKTDADLKRRSFLLAASVGGAGAVVAMLSGTGAEPAAEAGATAKTPQAKGYQLSEHVRRYYRTTRI